MSEDFEALLARVRACTICADALPLGPRPIVRGTPKAKLLLIGQAPGTRVHKTGIPWNDPSGERLRDWLQMSPGDFYDEDKIAIVSMGFCYPGVNPRGGDEPPRTGVAPADPGQLVEDPTDFTDRTICAKALPRQRTKENANRDCAQLADLRTRLPPSAPPELA